MPNNIDSLVFLVLDLNSLKISDHKLSEVRTQIADLIKAYSNNEIRSSEFIELASNIKVEAVILAENQESILKQQVVELLRKATSIVSHIN